jgi:hypothetical protein
MTMQAKTSKAGRDYADNKDGKHDLPHLIFDLHCYLHIQLPHLQPSPVLPAKQKKICECELMRCRF